MKIPRQNTRQRLKAQLDKTIKRNLGVDLAASRPAASKADTKHNIGYAGLDSSTLTNMAERGSLTDNQALDSHFALLSGKSLEQNKPPHGRIVHADELTEEFEQKLVKDNGGRGLLAPYGRYKPDAKPVIIVHGITGHPGGMQKIIDHFDKDPDKQVYLFFYDDNSRYLNRSANDLAGEISKLREEHLSNKKPDLTIVSHSMGGHISQGALNTLADPKWFKGDDDKEANNQSKASAANFGEVKHISLDTIWRGYGEPPINLRKWLPMERAWMDMLSNSDYMGSLYAKKLPDNFSNQHIEADYAAGHKELNSHVGLQRLDDDDFAALVQHFSGDGYALKGHGELRTQLRALQNEQDYPALEQQLRAAAGDSQLSRERFLQILQTGIGLVPGNHTSILDNPSLLVELDRLEKP